MTPDVAGFWPGSAEPVRGPDPYIDRLAELIGYVADIRVDVAEYALNGDFAFIRWIMHGTGKGGPFELSGIDRGRLVDGLVAENIIRFDRRELEDLVGKPLPWA